MLRTARPLRFAAAAVAFMFAALLLLVAAGAAHAAVWVIPATGRAFPATPPGAVQTDRHRRRAERVRGRPGRAPRRRRPRRELQLERRQRPAHRRQYDPGPGVLRERHPAHDRLEPARRAVSGPAGARSFDSQIAVPGFTTSFYLLTHVPLDTPAGDYGATLVVQNGLDEPCRSRSACTCGDFGWAQLSTRTGFGLDEKALRRSVEGSGLRWNNGAERSRLLLNTYMMLAQHGICSLAPARSAADIPRRDVRRGEVRRHTCPVLGRGRPRPSATRIPWCAGGPGPSVARMTPPARSSRRTSPSSAPCTRSTAGRTRPTPTSWTRRRSTPRSSPRKTTPACSTPPPRRPATASSSCSPTTRGRGVSAGSSRPTASSTTTSTSGACATSTSSGASRLCASRRRRARRSGGTPTPTAGWPRSPTSSSRSRTPISASGAGSWSAGTWTA